MMEAILKFIGIVHSNLKKLEECPKQENENAPLATVEIFSEFLDGTKDIEVGAQIILFTWFHLSDRSELVCHPRDNPLNVLTGVFSTRSSNRPNPIGIHVVEVLSVKGGLIEVSHLEALNETPVIDIKPLLK